MNRRREVLRVAGWLAVICGLASTTAAVMSDALVADLMGGYGLLIALAGGWALIGLHVLSRREQVATERRVATRAVSNRTGVLGR